MPCFWVFWEAVDFSFKYISAHIEIHPFILHVNVGGEWMVISVFE